ncbi:translation factor GTPase family protein [Dorea sp. D27]|uniref:translation factor GTPase family protein n=1 Tax=Dorea sp. D27 TaxID=658665 RepID=UPI00067362AB|nr:TetM/TetW/TetO/TetS family tetracycline resistance ribosomal protection protein [Dorea sp. D27]KMZ55652.1 putative tetracycline resistance protein TetP [Dorea sp. D27]
MKRIVLGILAHADAGKTTLSEGMLYISGAVRKMGRVDHQDAFLDTYEMEKERGITIFSKQAVFSFNDIEITLMDTPGHVDFSAEMERTLQILDYAVLVISGADGVQGHTETLWRLLARYGIPAFLFINKMDQEGTDKERILQELQVRLGEECVDFSPERDMEQFHEQIAMCDEDLLERYLSGVHAGEEEIAGLIRERKVSPCFFGSALKLTGVEELLRGIAQYTRHPACPEAFGAKVYKIARDRQGSRLTYMKITGGSLKVKEAIETRDGEGRAAAREKADQIRIYSGTKYEAVEKAEAGMVCAVTGLAGTYPGQGLGTESASDMPVLEPVLHYRVVLPDGADPHKVLADLKQLEEEEPELHIIWNERLGEIHVKLMGEVQIGIIKRIIQERFGVSVQFDTGHVVYKETIQRPAEGVGHFEPLRHYAEVHLLLEPLEEGSGLVFDSAVGEDELDGNWQRLILTHLEERDHPGVLTGSVITDMKITLIAGRGHLKHTEGGDFRQATYRAVRQGLKRAGSILLEPYYKFRMEVPAESVGRAMSDIRRMNGDFEAPQTQGDMSVLSGNVPVASMQGYQTELNAYTRGRGRISCMPGGYHPCKNADEVIEMTGYDSEKDLENPTGSVFCAHGAGFVVSWDKVEEYMHVDSGWQDEDQDAGRSGPEAVCGNRPDNTEGSPAYTEQELEEIFVRTYGPVKRKKMVERRRTEGGSISAAEYRPRKKREQAEEYLLVDGYNIIFAWDELKELAKVNIMSARDKLMDIMSNYQGFRKMTLILVFDAYKVEGNPGSISTYHNIYVVYTKEAETADQYIEKTVHRIGRKHNVTVATSDALEQVIILGQGGRRLSAQGLREEVELAMQELREEHLKESRSPRSYLFDNLPEELADYMEDMRMGKDSAD